MKTFESEFAELANWIRKKITDYQEEIKKSSNREPKGHDSELTYSHSQDVEEYNRRLIELKKKYGKDTDSISTMTQESNLSKAKKVHA